MSRVVPAAYDSLVNDERGRTYYRNVPGKTRRVMWWWSRQQQLWVVMVEDAEGNQIGGSQYCPRSSVPAWIATMVDHVTNERTPW